MTIRSLRGVGVQSSQPASLLSMSLSEAWAFSSALDPCGGSESEGTCTLQFLAARAVPIASPQCCPAGRNGPPAPPPAEHSNSALISVAKKSTQRTCSNARLAACDDFESDVRTLAAAAHSAAALAVDSSAVLPRYALANLTKWSWHQNWTAGSSVLSMPATNTVRTTESAVARTFAERRSSRHARVISPASRELLGAVHSDSQLAETMPRSRGVAPTNRLLPRPFPSAWSSAVTAARDASNLSRSQRASSIAAAAVGALASTLARSASVASGTRIASPQSQSHAKLVLVATSVEWSDAIEASTSSPSSPRSVAIA